MLHCHGIPHVVVTICTEGQSLSHMYYLCYELQHHILLAFQLDMPLQSGVLYFLNAEKDLRLDNARMITSYR